MKTRSTSADGDHDWAFIRKRKGVAQRGNRKASRDISRVMKRRTRRNTTTKQWFFRPTAGLLRIGQSTREIFVMILGGYDIGVNQPAFIKETGRSRRNKKTKKKNEEVERKRKIGKWG